jgi:hypothetical protein
MNQPASLYHTPMEDIRDQGRLPWAMATDFVFRFSTSKTRIVGFQYHSLVASEYIEDEERLALDFPVGTVIIRGPGTMKLYDQFCAGSQRATMIKADGKNILSVELRLREKKKTD